MLTLHVRAWRLLLPGVVGLLVACGGSSGSDHPPPPDDTEQAGAGGEAGAPATAGAAGSTTAGGKSGDDVLTGSCEWGASRECRVYFGDPPGSLGCWVGVQTCLDGQWQECDIRVDPATLDES